MRGGRVTTFSPCLTGRTSEEAVAQMLQNVRRHLLSRSRHLSKWAPAGESVVGREVGGVQEKNDNSSFVAQCDRKYGNAGLADGLSRGFGGLGFQTKLWSLKSSNASTRKKSVRHVRGVSSQRGSRGFLQDSRPYIASEGVIRVHRKPHLGLGGVGCGRQESRAGPIRKAIFDASASNETAFIYSRISHSGKASDGDERLAPNSQYRTAKPSSGSGQGIFRVNYGVSANGGRPQAASGVLGGRQRAGQSSNSGPDGRGPLIRPADVSQKVIARIANVPKFMFKSDLLWIFKGSNTMLEDIMFFYDTKYRVKFIQLQFPSVESFQSAQRSLLAKGRFGGRHMKMTMEKAELDGINVGLTSFRGRSVLMVRGSSNTTTDDVERFFSGYALDCNHPVKFVRSLIQAPFGGDQSVSGSGKPEYEIHVLARFKTELEALRALREKQGANCREFPTELRFIE